MIISDKQLTYWGGAQYLYWEARPLCPPAGYTPGFSNILRNRQTLRNRVILRNGALGVVLQYFLKLLCEITSMLCEFCLRDLVYDIFTANGTIIYEMLLFDLFILVIMDRRALKLILSSGTDFEDIRLPCDD